MLRDRPTGKCNEAFVMVLACVACVKRQHAFTWRHVCYNRYVTSLLQVRLTEDSLKLSECPVIIAPLRVVENEQCAGNIAVIL